MKSPGIFDSNIALLNKVLDLRSANQRVISSNIANAETPGYSPAKFEFEEQLQQAVTKRGVTLQVSDPKHISLGDTSLQSVTGQITYQPDQTGIGDENGVSVDQEMIALSENQIMYESAAQILKKKLTLMKYIIQDGQ